MESRDVIFYKNKFFIIPKSINSQKDDKLIEFGQKHNANNEQNQLRMCKKKIRTKTSFGQDFLVY